MKIFNHVGFGLGQSKPVLEQINEKSRYYLTPKGIKYPSITTVLSADPEKQKSLDNWARSIGYDKANRIKVAAAQRGTKLHDLAERLLKNEDISDVVTKHFGVNLIYKAMWDYFKPLLYNIDNIHCLETGLYSHHLRMAGTVDCIAEYKGRLCIIDYKTSTKLKEKAWIKDYFMQCAAYAIMYEELTGIPVPNIRVLIAIEGEHPQLFEERRDNWVKGLLEARDYFEKTNIIHKEPQHGVLDGLYTA